MEHISKYLKRYNARFRPEKLDLTKLEDVAVFMEETNRKLYGINPYEDQPKDTPDNR